MIRPLIRVTRPGPTLSSIIAEVVHIENSRFTFDGREFQINMFDEPRDRVLFKSSRQCEKCVLETAPVVMATGERRPIKDVGVGDLVASMDIDASRTRVGRVTWKSERIRKSCVRITTALGHVVEVARTHPIRQWDRWTPAGDLAVRDRLATIRRLAGYASDPCDPDVVAFIGYMLGDGCCTSTLGFTQNIDSPVLADFRRICARFGWSYREYHKAESDSVDLRFNRTCTEAYGTLKEFGLIGLSSAAKHIPARFMCLPLDQTKILIQSLWSTDGCIREVTGAPAGYELVYCSISEMLAKQVQSLLWKLGIPTGLRRQIPKAYIGTGKVAYLIRVRTRAGIDAFLRELKVPGKTVPAPTADPNDNRDTYPIEIASLIRRIVESKRLTHGTTLHAAGLHKTPSYALSKRRLREYVEFFSADPGYDLELVHQLTTHLDTDLFWDRIVAIEDIGEQWCYDISVDGTENFVADGVVTHNSTSLAIRAACYAAYYPGFKLLHVTPRDEQVRAFSKKRFEKLIICSPKLRWLLQGPNVVNNQKDKIFANMSEATFRSAFRDADAVRGYSADCLSIDEYQDMQRDHIGVIEETQSHATRRRADGSIIKLRFYAGTPKTHSNPIEECWQASTQYMWVVVCHHCTHYNEQIGLANIGPDYLQCAVCHKPVFAANGFWVAYGDPNAEWAGYHINTLLYDHCDWRDIWAKLDGPKAYTTQVFINEVLGYSHDAGAKVITFDELRACCDDRDALDSYRRQHGEIFGSVDWGGHGRSTTVFHAGTHINGKYRILGIRRWNGMDPGAEIAEVAREALRFGCHYVAVDFGGGARANQELAERLPKDVKVVQYHLSQNVNHIVLWKPRADMFVLSKPRSIARMISALKKKRVSFFKWEQFRPYASDIECLYEEYNPRTRMVTYDHPTNTPDDFAHSLNLGMITADIRLGLIKPIADAGGPGQRVPDGGDILVA
jgi:hypothetical protein